MHRFFKTYCYLKGSATEEPSECAEISVQATPEILRQLATFLMDSAEKLEATGLGDAGGHFHLQDEWAGWHPDFPDLVVVAPPLP